MHASDFRYTTLMFHSVV